MELLSEPHRSMYREIGMLQLLYIYGGIVVPNSFVCLKNLKPLYSEGEMPFVTEEINRTSHVAGKKDNLNFMPSMKMMGAQKGCPAIKRMLAENKVDAAGHFTVEPKFLGNMQQWLYKEVVAGTFTTVNGRLIGTKTTKGKQILLEDLMSENYLDIDDNAFGIYIPGDEILKRPKYQWFAYLPSEDVLKTTPVIVKYLKSSAVNAETTVVQSVTTL
jgi:hypothetical protein